MQNLDDKQPTRPKYYALLYLSDVSCVCQCNFLFLIMYCCLHVLPVQMKATFIYTSTNTKAPKQLLCYFGGCHFRIHFCVYM